MRRTLLCISLLLLIISLAAPAWAWPPTLEQFTALATQAAPPGWQLAEAEKLQDEADCGPQLVVVFELEGEFTEKDYLEYRLDLDVPEPEDKEVPGLRRDLEGRKSIFLQAGTWRRFSYLTVYFPGLLASLTVGTNDEMSFDEMAQLYYHFPLDKLLPPSKAAK
jgi:hypothetical protein